MTAMDEPAIPLLALTACWVCQAKFDRERRQASDDSADYFRLTDGCKKYHAPAPIIITSATNAPDASNRQLLLKASGPRMAKATKVVIT